MHIDNRFVAAAAIGQIDEVHKLIKRADIRINNNAALRMAAHNGHVGIVTTLLDRYGNSELQAIRSACHEPKLQTAIRKEIEKRQIELMIEYCRIHQTPMEI